MVPNGVIFALLQLFLWGKTVILNNKFIFEHNF